MIQMQKNRRESLVIRLREYKGRRFVDCRLHYPGEDGELRPTRQGFTLSLDHAGDLADAIVTVARQDHVDDD
ncbi:transcriptional coactivator p15/PC4 family protein [Tateyamaria pelophila]|uniref:transcriptional coactivator p15/PC4 family protein n=1 Tax=Tateyamaria pelophila TaxID=328415 RepID=UPI001CBD69D1|nr:transcriptional coactivator p15/PC4 family protein [Tateyamaria pelophila]